MVKRGPFTEDEDRAILAAHAIHGNKWAVISRSIPGRYEPRTPRLRLTHPEQNRRPARDSSPSPGDAEAGLSVFQPEGRNFAPELANPSLFFHDSTRTYSVPERHLRIRAAWNSDSVTFPSEREYYRIFQREGRLETSSAFRDCDSCTLGAPKNTSRWRLTFFVPAPAARNRRTDNQVKNRFNSTLRRLFANQTKPAVDAAAAKKRKPGADAGKSGSAKRHRGSASPKSSTDSDDDIITGLEQLVQASLQVERHASGGEESDGDVNGLDGLDDEKGAKNAGDSSKEAGDSSVRGAKAFSDLNAKAFSDLASLAAKGFAGVPGISASQMAATAAAFENYQKAAQAASSAAFAAGFAASVPGGAFDVAKLRQPSFHSAQGSDAPSTSTIAFPGALAAFGGNAAAANPLFASLVQAGNPAMMMGANQALVQRLFFEAQIRNAMAPAAINAGKAVPNGSEASDMSAHGGTAWAAAMAAMSPQLYAQMLGNPAIFSR